jgi:hypothetical protein
VFMKLRTYLKEKGQTSVEYILMLAVSVSMGVALLKKTEAFLITNPDSYMNTQLKIYTSLFDPQNLYKKYPLPR